MKALIILLTCGYMFSANNLSAQQPQEKMLPVVTITGKGASVSEKVRDAFDSSFKNAKNMRWYEANQNLLVKFILDDQEHNALFRKNGSLIYHITYGFADNLPSTVRNLVTSRYSNYSIARVFNIVQDNRKVWVVNLESEKDMVITRIEDREMNEVSRTKKISSKTVTAGANQ